MRDFLTGRKLSANFLNPPPLSLNFSRDFECPSRAVGFELLQGISRNREALEIKVGPFASVRVLMNGWGASYLTAASAADERPGYPGEAAMFNNLYSVFSMPWSVYRGATELTKE